MLALLTSNYLINIGLLAWMSAQVFKIILHFVFTGKWVFERMFGAGGMPSSHSALVCSMTLAMAKLEGFASPLFGLTFAFAMVVMYDAMGVRRPPGSRPRCSTKSSSAGSLT